MRDRMQISTVDSTALQQYGKQVLYKYSQECNSMEQAAQNIVRDFYDMFRTEEGDPEFALVRVFRLTKFEELDPELQASCTIKSGQCLALMGTIGIEEAWCDRRQSQSRKAIPINQNMSPMFKGVFRELGFSWEDSTGDELVSGAALGAMGMIRYFHVEDVSSSSYITDQEQFVEPYGIQSVVACGSQFLSDAAFVLIGFSTVPVTEEQAEKLVKLMPHISTLLATFDVREALWIE